MSLDLKCVICARAVPEGRDREHVTCSDYCEVFFEHLRFWIRTKINHVNGCIVWTGPFEGYGYGVLYLYGKTMPAHRYSYEMFFGKIPDGLVIDHLCRNRSCVNPAHLEAVTSKENTLRGEGFTAVNHAKTHCKRGHPLFGPNLGDRSTPGRRSCKECNRDRMRRRREAKAASAQVGS